MKAITAALYFLFFTGIVQSQTISCNLTPLHALDFFVGSDYDDAIVWPESTIEEIEASLSDSIENTDAIQFLPLAMVEMNNYFKTGITQDRFYRIIRYSKLFALALNDDSWTVGMEDFCGDVNRMIGRFNAWYDNDTMMAELFFTDAAGPYYGSVYTQPGNALHGTDSIALGESGNMLFIASPEEEHIIYVKDAAGNIHHSFHLLDDYKEDDVRTLFSEVKCIVIPDFGYSVLVFLSDGICRLYFDENGRLRFYYIL